MYAKDYIICSIVRHGIMRRDVGSGGLERSRDGTYGSYSDPK
jgi:hypothetical protein